jgi:Fe(3+) dicitrate transport protein
MSPHAIGSLPTRLGRDGQRQAMPHLAQQTQLTIPEAHELKATTRLKRICLAISLALGASHAFAEEGQAPAKARARELETVVVKGSLLGASKKEDVRTYAGSRQVISHEQLADGANRSIDDALQHVPGVKILDETGTGVLPQIMVRGLYESRSGRAQVLMDGIPLSLAPYGQTSLSLFPVTLNQIDRIDIVRGGAAVQYGPNNVGGVINLVSKPIPENWTTTLGERITAGGDGKFLRDTYLSTGGYLTANFGMQLDADWLKGQYWRDHSDTNVKNFRWRAEWWLADDKLLKASVERYVANMNLAGALSADDYEHNPRQSTRPLDDFTGRTTRTSLVYEQHLGAWGPFDESHFSWTNFDWTTDRNFIFGSRLASAESSRPDLPPQLYNDGPRSFDVYGTQPQLTLHADSGGVTQLWTVGTRVEREHIGYIAQATELDNGAYTLFRDWQFHNRAFAAFASDAIGFYDDRLMVTPGVRYEHLDSDFTDRISGKRYSNDIRDLLPGITVGYQASNQWYFYTDAQRSLRPPQITMIVYGNNLKSELSWNYEVGTRYTPTANTSISFDLYHINFDNQIQYNSTTASYFNLGKTRNQGAEVQLEWSPASLRELKFDAGYSYLDAAQKSGQYQGLRVPYTSRNQVNLGASYAFGDTVLAFNGYYFSGAFSNAANTKMENAIASVGALPAYWVANTQITRTLMKRGSSVLKGSLAVNNLFNRHYWYRGIDTSPWGREPAPERTATLGLELTF